MCRTLPLALLAVLVVTSAGAQQPDEVDKEVVKLVNAYRAKKGAGDLTFDERLTAVAQEHAQGMAKANKYGDTGKDGHLWMGKRAADRLKDAKYAYSVQSEVTTVRAASKKPAEPMVKALIASKANEPVLRQKDFTHAGVGAAKAKDGRWYFVLLFAVPKQESATVAAVIENRTEHTISFSIGKTAGQLKPGERAQMTATTREKVKVSVTWPAEKKGDKKKVEEFEIADGKAYAFAAKKGGGFAFEKVGSAAQKPDEVEKLVVKLVNAYRVKKGAGELAIDEALAAVAQEHAQGMAEADKYGDDDKDGHVWMKQKVGKRLEAAKYVYSDAGENVGLVPAGTTAPAEDMVEAWIGSKGHEAQMRSKTFTHTGVGAAKSKEGRWFFVQLFSVPGAKEKK